MSESVWKFWQRNAAQIISTCWYKFCRTCEYLSTWGSYPTTSGFVFLKNFAGTGRPALSGTLCPLPGAGCGPRLRAVWMTCSQRLGGSIFVLPSVWFWTVFFQDHRNSRMQRAFPGREDPFPVSRNDSRPGVSKKRTRGERCHKDTHTQYPYFFRWAETLPGERCKRCAICQMLFLFRKYRV